jgi:excisionase family DNA binding protein
LFLKVLVSLFFVFRINISGVKKMDRLLTAEDIADLLNTKTDRVWALARENHLPCVRLGKRQMRFDRQAVEQFIASGGSKDGATQKREGK